MALKPSLRRHRPNDSDEDLNILPIMNLFVLLIPFLLISAVFIHIGIIDTSLPIINSTDSDTGQELKQGIALTVTIVNQGFIIKGKLKNNPSGQVPVEMKESLKNYLSLKGELIPKAMNGQYDFKQLSNALITIKNEFPDEDTIFIIPEPYVLYDDIIKTMDASRLTDLILDDGMRKPMKLFENAVIAMITEY